MKKAPKPAEVEEEDSDTGEAKPNTRSSASYKFRGHKPPEQKRTPPRKSRLPPLKGVKSNHLGTVQQVASRNEDGQLLNIVAGLYDDNDEVWDELVTAGKLSPFFYVGNRFHPTRYSLAHINNRQSHKYRNQDSHQPRDQPLHSRCDQEEPGSSNSSTSVHSRRHDPTHRSSTPLRHPN